jgi:ABC-type glutathione transport system ATPase component
LFPFKAEFWKNEVFQTDSPAQVHSHGAKTSGVSQKGDRVDGQISAAIANDERLASGHAKFANYEELGEKYRVLEKEGRVLKIENLRKEFGNFTAVDDVSVNMYEGEIFALLGHNGAGKTTAISMVTGLIMPTQGEGSFRDVDLFGQMKKIRTTLGVCPQLDVLFEDLTVKEHLEMY